MTLAEQREQAISNARAIAEGVKAAGRQMTPDDLTKINGLLDEVKSLDGKIFAAKQGDALLERLGSLDVNEQHPPRQLDQNKASTLGEHFVKSVGDQLRANRNVPGASVTAPEWGGSKAQAATDPVVTSGYVFPQIDTTVVRGYRRPLVIADLCSAGTLSGQSITYFVEGTRAGNFTTVAEGAQKPQMSYNFTTVTEALTKIAGLIKLSDEMVEDLPYLVSEINTRLLYDLGIFEEAQLLNGDGTAPNLRGLLNRSGIQTEAGATNADNLNAVFRASTKVQVATGYAVDGIVIHPNDYQVFRLLQDQNKQYYAGGPFTGAYGEYPAGPNGSYLPLNPMLWGFPTVVTPAIAQGTVLVGAFAQAATVYRKGSVIVSSTNSNVNDFEKNLITVRAEERLALAVRVPAAFVKVTMTP